MRSLTKYIVKTPEQAVLYLAECSLATVADLVMKKSKSKSEFKRQIEIAQTAIDWIKDFKIDVPEGSRIKKVNDVGGKVATWAASYECA